MHHINVDICSISELQHVPHPFSRNAVFMVFLLQNFWNNIQLNNEGGN